VVLHLVVYKFNTKIHGYFIPRIFATIMSTVIVFMYTYQTPKEKFVAILNASMQLVK